MTKATPPKIIVVSQPPLTDKQLEKAFVVDDKNTLWRAILQVIEMLSREARYNGDASIGQPELSANFHGGAEHLGILRDMMFDLRERGIKRHKEEDFKP
jgi:hypothetical protein